MTRTGKVWSPDDQQVPVTSRLIAEPPMSISAFDPRRPERASCRASVVQHPRANLMGTSADHGGPDGADRGA